MNVSISDEAERVQSVSYPQTRSLSGLYISNTVTLTEETGETKVRTDCLNFDVSQLGLPDAFCENTGHFVNSEKSRLHS